jgi:hypothetical protein
MRDRSGVAGTGSSGISLLFIVALLESGEL